MSHFMNCRIAALHTAVSRAGWTRRLRDNNKVSRLLCPLYSRHRHWFSVCILWEEEKVAVDAPVWRPSPQLWCMEKLKIAPQLVRFQLSWDLEQLQSRRDWGKGGGGILKKACIITMHGLWCKELQGKNKALHSSLSRKQAQDAEAVHSSEPWVRKGREEGPFWDSFHRWASVRIILT